MGKRRNNENLRSAQRILERAANLYRADRLTEAAELYSKIHSDTPEYVAATYQLGMIDLKLAQVGDAIERFKSVIATNPKSYDAHYNLGFSCQQLGRWHEALKAYEMARDLAPDDVSLQFSLAAAFAALGRAEDAVACYRNLMRNSDARLDALIRLAVLDSAQITVAELAEMQHAAKSMLGDRKKTQLQFALGEVLERHSEFDQAFAAF